MDRKTKKRVTILKQKREKLRNELSVVKKFPDDPTEIPRLEAEIARLTEELEKLERA